MKTHPTTKTPPPTTKKTSTSIRKEDADENEELTEEEADESSEIVETEVDESSTDEQALEIEGEALKKVEENRIDTELFEEKLEEAEVC